MVFQYIRPWIPYLLNNMISINYGYQWVIVSMGACSITERPMNCEIENDDNNNAVFSIPGGTAGPGFDISSFQNVF